MGVIKGTMRSDSLELTVSYTAILPEEKEGPYPVLYLLHGLSDDDHAWLYNTSLVRYATGRNIAIFMPQVHRSFYTNMVSGGDYWTFISEEFPKKMHNQFRLTTKREETFVAGLSMGGYGAFKLALSHPERFRGAASLSGAVDIVSLWEEDNERKDLFEPIFGSLDRLKGSDVDLVALLEKLSDSPVKPSFYQSCGTEDFLYDNNLSFYHRIKDLDYTYVEEPGDHNWAFWDKQIQEVLLWMDQL